MLGGTRKELMEQGAEMGVQEKGSSGVYKTG